MRERGEGEREKRKKEREIGRGEEEEEEEGKRRRDERRERLYHQTRNKVLAHVTNAASLGTLMRLCNILCFQNNYTFKM